MSHTPNFKLNMSNTSGSLYSSIVASQSRHPHTFLQRYSYHRLFRHTSVGLLLLLLASCSVTKKMGKQAEHVLLSDTAISTGHIGISIYEPATNSFWYNHDATKYFVPASNTKLFSLYAGLKYLGDSVPGMRYEADANGVVRIQPTGDPSFLHPDYRDQPVYSFLQGQSNITLTNFFFTDKFLGRGWAWDDYKEAYMTQRSNLPVYGNVITLRKQHDSISIVPSTLKFLLSGVTNLEQGFDVEKHWDNNILTIIPGSNQVLQVPFSPNALDVLGMLQDTLHTTITPDLDYVGKLNNVVYSRPLDSLFIPMMHRSDNFFAEQTLMMASNELLGYMSDRKLIDTLLQTELKGIPQVPKWVDGSGLSRYNLFTPQSIVFLLDKMKNEYGLERLKKILPTGGEGTLAAYYKEQAGFIFAKTGTLSNHCALSGFIITKKNKLLVFSVLANNYKTGATPVRRAVEKFLVDLREKY